MLDLARALIRRGARGARFIDLARDIPYYREQLEELEDRGEASRAFPGYRDLKRRFEADKDQLRRAGFPLTEHPHTGRYYLDVKKFFLPYLVLQDAQPAAHDARVERVFATAETVQTLTMAARRVDRLGDPYLAAAARRALRLIIGPDKATNTGPESEIIRLGPSTDPAVQALLFDALQRRKRVTFHYESPRRPTARVREVEPYGLYYANASWYLVGRDTDPRTDGLRNFRLDRMRDVEANGRRPAMADYNFPSDFKLHDWAAPRAPWEFGTGTPIEVIVLLTVAAGPAQPLMRQGEAIDRHRKRCRFQVRDIDFFVNLLLEHTESVALEADGPVRTQWRAVASRVKQLHAGTPSMIIQGKAKLPVPRLAPIARRRSYAKSAEQFTRLSALVSLFADGKPHSVSEIASVLEIPERDVMADLVDLQRRSDESVSANGGLHISIDGRTVTISGSAMLPRPLRISLEEAVALHLGLDLLAMERGEDFRNEHIHARYVVEKMKVASPVEPKAVDEPPHGRAKERVPVPIMKVIPYHPNFEMSRIREFQRAIAERRWVRMAYAKSGATEAQWYEIKPYGLVESYGVFYVNGVRRSGDQEVRRQFRIDRVSVVSLTEERFKPDPTYDPLAPLSDSERRSEGTRTLIVRFSGQAARLVAEREGRAVGSDKTFVWQYPLLDEAWAVRMVLQYGAEAEVLAPVSMRERIVTVLDQALNRPVP